MPRLPALKITVVVAAGILASASRAGAQQDLGHNVLGTIGLKAGAVPPSGLYVQDAFFFYTADHLVDRRGDAIPVSLSLKVLTNAAGAGGTFEAKRIKTWFSFAFAVPIARVRATSDLPEASLDRFGIGDVYVKPLQLGWRPPGVDILVAYGFYIPMHHFEPGPRGGVSTAQWTNQFSLGGTVYKDIGEKARLHVSALASYDNYLQKLGIDLTRGDIVQLQGGVGVTVRKILDAGFTAGSLWQVRDDRGSALPAVLRGTRDQAVGLGPEVAVTIPVIRTRVLVRYEHDVRARTRPLGQLLFLSAAVKVW